MFFEIHRHNNLQVPLPSTADCFVVSSHILSEGRRDIGQLYVKFHDLFALKMHIFY